MSTEIAYSRKWALPACILISCGLAGCVRHSVVEAGDGAEPEEPAAVFVQTAAARIGTIEETIEGIGRSEALPNQLVTLTPALEGHVRRILANLGDQVAEGDVIVELDPTLAQAEVAEKLANRDTLRAALALVEAEPRPEDRKGPELAIEQARAAVERTKAVVDRLRPLRSRNEVSEAQFFDAEQALVQARLGEQSSRAQLDLLLAGPRPEAVAEAKARLDTAEELLALARARLELYSIRSPIRGILDSLACHPGQTIAPGTQIGEVVDSSRLFVTVWLTPPAAARAAPGQAARLTLAAPGRPRADGPEAISVLGTVASIGRIVDPATGNLPVRIVVDDPQARLAVGETISATIVAREHADVLTVPTTAVIDLGEGPLVVVVREGLTASLHPTSTATHGQWTIISGTDLEAGEQVLIDGGFNLPDGTHVRTPAEDAVTERAAVVPAAESEEPGS